MVFFFLEDVQSFYAIYHLKSYKNKKKIGKALRKRCKLKFNIYMGNKNNKYVANSTYY